MVGGTDYCDESVWAENIQRSKLAGDHDCPFVICGEAKPAVTYIMINEVHDLGDNTSRHSCQPSKTRK